jgi:hypothetical protein
VNTEATWEALNDWLSENEPRCDGRPLFTAEQRTEEERAACALVCAACPVADLCDAYARAAKVTFGYWAGVDRAVRKNTAPGGSRHSTERQHP